MTDSVPQIAMLLQEGRTLPKGVEDLANHVVHCCNAMLGVDQAIDSVKTEGTAVLNTISEGMEHSHSLLNTVGPLLAEVESPADALAYIFASVNQGIVHQYQQQMMMSMALGQVDRAEYLEGRLDHVIAVITQVFADVFGQHLATINYAGVSQRDEDGDQG